MVWLSLPAQDSGVTVGKMSNKGSSRVKPYHTIEMKSSKGVSDHSQVSDVYVGPEL